MKIARASTPDGIYIGRVDGDILTPLWRDNGSGSDPLHLSLESPDADLNSASPIAEAQPLADCHIHSPLVRPEKIIGIGLNYRGHAEEAGLPVPSTPLCFAMTPNALVGTGEAIRCPAPLAAQLDYEAEIAVVIGKPIYRATVQQAEQAILGYALCNDVTARDAQFGDGQWYRGKSFDTFLPLGPYIVTADEVGNPGELMFDCRVNETIMQKGATSDMIFTFAEVISHVSQAITLRPGDVIATGTPAGVGFIQSPAVYLRNGDIVEISCDALGTLQNRISIFA